MKRSDKRWRLGIDLGGTKIEGVVLDPQGKTVLRKRIDTRQSEGYQAILKRVQGLYRILLKKSYSKNPTLGIGTPGSISRVTGLLKNSNTLCLNRRPLKTDLVQLLKRPLVLENDANCFALAEARWGAGRGAAMVFGVIMGTGCGGGLILNGKLWTGLQSLGGEWGHMSIDPKGPLCYCGSRGCVETLISGGGLESRYREQFRQRKSLKDIAADYRLGAKNERIFMSCFFKNFGRSLANLINALDPSVIVLGGGLSNISELYSIGIEQVRKNIFSDSLDTPIVQNELGDSAGVLGAALVGQ
jgi:fructokinase